MAAPSAPVIVSPVGHVYELLHSLFDNFGKHRCATYKHGTLTLLHRLDATNVPYIIIVRSLPLADKGSRRF